MTPVFLIAPNIRSGHTISLLLSQQLQPRAYRREKESYLRPRNFFIDKGLLRQLQLCTSGDASVKEIKDKITILLSAGMSNELLWGMLCSYHHFFSLELHTFFPDACYIFINDPETTAQPHGTAHYLPVIDAFCREFPEKGMVVDARNAVHVPELILSALPFDKEAILYHAPVESKQRERYRNVKSKTPTSKATVAVDDSILLPHHVLYHYNWFRGTDIMAILICSRKEDTAIVAAKITQLTASFAGSPVIHIFCSEERLQQDILRNLNSTLSLKPAVHMHTGMLDAEMLNTLINTADCPWILIDRLSMQFSFSSLFAPFQNPDPPLCVFAEIPELLEYRTPEDRNITAKDALAYHIIRENLAFSRQAWQQCGGFDPATDKEMLLWDFALSILHYEGNFVTAITGSIRMQTKTDESTQVATITGLSGYQYILDKYADVAQLPDNEMLREYQEREEIKKLSRRLTVAHTQLQHHNEEKDALNHYSQNLNRRLKSLEEHVYFRIEKKLVRIKKIFFKKKTPGTGTLRRILDFIIFTFSSPGFRIIRKVAANGLRKMYLLVETQPVQILFLNEEQAGSTWHTYHELAKARLHPDRLWRRYIQQAAIWKQPPKISIIMPVYNPPPNLLKAALDSVLEQHYDNWELCIADDCSPNKKIRKLLIAYATRDKRIKVVFRKENGHISACSNSALTMATGEYVLLLDHDDLLTPDCLSEVVHYTQIHPDVDIVYSDEDKIDKYKQYSMPHYKTDWAPHSLLSRNYFGHVVVLRKSLMDRLGGFRIGFEGSQDYDLILRATEMTNKIGHIPRILYHWRIHNESAAQSEEVKPYAYIAAKKALEEALVRRQTPGTVQYLPGLRGYRIRYEIIRPGKVSIIIPTKDQVKLLKNAIDSILNNTSYKDYEILVLNNNSKTKAYYDFAAAYSEKYPDTIRFIDAHIPFNFAKLMNIGKDNATGEYLLLLNNDIEVIHNDWLEIMLSHAQHKHTGAVGAKLLYPDDTVQHAGVIVGLGGIAGHAFVSAHRDAAGYFNYIQSMNNFSAVTAACLMCRRSVFEAVGGMDEQFEVEYNDVDFCLKLVKAGYYNVYLPDVELYHFESVTRGHPHQNKASYTRHIREMNLFESKWKPFIRQDPWYNPNLNIGVHDFSISFVLKDDSLDIDTAPKLAPRPTDNKSLIKQR